MARKLRYQPENVCYHVVTRIAHREFFFDDAEKDIIVRLIANVERFTGVRVLAYAIMSNHVHLLLFIDKPATLQAWEGAGYFLGYDFDKFKEGNLYKVSELNTFTQAEVDEFRRLHEMPILERYETSRDELVERLKAVMRPKPFADLMAKWEKMSEDELEDEYWRHLSRMYDLSAFMKILKQDITQYYNLRKHHSGGLWEGRFKDSIIERAVDAMSSVATYIDLNAWRICPWVPMETHWGTSLGSCVTKRTEVFVGSRSVCEGSLLLNRIRMNRRRSRRRSGTLRDQTARWITRSQRIGWPTGRVRACRSIAANSRLESPVALLVRCEGE